MTAKYLALPEKRPQPPRLILGGSLAVVVFMALVFFFINPSPMSATSYPVEKSKETPTPHDFFLPYYPETLSDADQKTLALFPFTAHISEALQIPELPGGCELVALTSVLRSMGYELSLTELADNYLDFSDEGDFVHVYSGSPYFFGAGFPPVIAETANTFLAGSNSAFRATELMGYGFDALSSLVGEGYPVLVWTTIGMEEPAFSGIFVDGYEWYDNEHCVVVYGITETEVLVNDPLEGLVSRELASFATIYDACGSMAIVIR